MVHKDSQNLSNMINFTSNLADNVSNKVRQLDLAKGRVVNCIKRVQDILDLKACTDGVTEALKEEDYESVCHRFRCENHLFLNHHYIKRRPTIFINISAWTKSHCGSSLLVTTKEDTMETTPTRSRSTIHSSSFKSPKTNYNRSSRKDTNKPWSQTTSRNLRGSLKFFHWSDFERSVSSASPTTCAPRSMHRPRKASPLWSSKPYWARVTRHRADGPLFSPTRWFYYSNE